MNPQMPPAIIPARTASGRWTKIGRAGIPGGGQSGAQPADDHLALDADVEQPRAGGDGEGQTTEDQRRRHDQRLGERPLAAERAPQRAPR